MTSLIVIGVGSMGWNHARVCSEMGVLAGICDNDAASVSRVAAEFEVRGFTDIHQAIDETNPSGAIIATPTSTHLDVAKDVISRGVNVLVEKPIAIDLESGHKIVKMAEEGGLVLSVGHIERYNPVIMAAKRILESGEWGEPVTISSRRVSNLPGRIRDVGVILDLGIHDIDNSVFLMGCKPVSVFARGGRLNQIEHEDHATIFIGFENRNSAVVEVNWITPMKVRTLSLTCVNSFVEIDYIKQSIKSSTSTYVNEEEPSKFPANISFEEKEIPVSYKEPLKSEIEDFVNAISDENIEPHVDGTQGLLALQIALAAKESLETGKIVKIGE